MAGAIGAAAGSDAVAGTDTDAGSDESRGKVKFVDMTGPVMA